MKENRMAGLLAALQRKGSEETTEIVESTQTTQIVETPQVVASTPVVRKRSTPSPAVKVKKRGTAVQFWMRDEDRQVIRELSAYLAAQGERATDSLVVRAALRMAKADAGLIRAFREAQSLDGRRKENE